MHYYKCALRIYVCVTYILYNNGYVYYQKKMMNDINILYITINEFIILFFKMNYITDKYNINLDVSHITCDDGTFIDIKLLCDFKTYICHTNVKSIPAFETITHNNVVSFVNYINKLISNNKLNVEFNNVNNSYSLSFKVSNDIVTDIYLFECIYDDNQQYQINSIIHELKKIKTILPCDINTIPNTTEINDINNIINNVTNELHLLQQQHDINMKLLTQVEKQYYDLDNKFDKLQTDYAAIKKLVDNSNIVNTTAINTVKNDITNIIGTTISDITISYIDKINTAKTDITTAYTTALAAHITEKHA